MKFKTKIFTFLSAGILLIGILSGCGSSGSGAGNEDEAANADAAQYRVAMLSDTSISDGGWGASCYQAMVDAAKNKGWTTAYSDNVETSEFVTVMTEYADQGYQLIFAPGNQYTDAVEQVAADYPDTYFCLLNGTFEAENVTSVLPDAKQIGTLAGVLAALLTETNQIGFIGGMELDTTRAKLESYTTAAKKVNPDVQVQSAYGGSFDDSAKGKEIAASMVSTYDVDVMFGDASALDTGARETLAQYENKYGIAQPGDLGSEDDPLIPCSIVTDNSALLEACMEDVVNGTYGNKTIAGNMENECLSIGTFSSIVPEDVKTQYLEYVEQIKAGTF